jgi:DNA invertase Pin-like site-specific DNA recombinase
VGAPIADITPPELLTALHTVEDLRKADVLIVHSMDRLARSFDDLRKIVLDLTGRGVAVQFLKEGMTFTGEDDKTAHLLLSLMGAFAEFERAIIKESQAECIAIAKRNGVYKGRQPVLNSARVADLRQQERTRKLNLLGSLGSVAPRCTFSLKSTIPEKA